MGKVLKDHKAVVVLNHYFLELDHVLMSKGLEQLDLTYCCNGKAILFTVHSNLFQCCKILRVDVDCFEDFSVSA